MGAVVRYLTGSNDTKLNLFSHYDIDELYVSDTCSPDLSSFFPCTKSCALKNCFITGNCSSGLFFTIF